MKRQILSKLPAISLLVASELACAFAGSTSVLLMAKIPFAFSVNGVSLPAGEYTVSTTDVLGALLIQETRTSKACIVQTHLGKSFAPDGNGKLLFNRYGDQYFLSEVFPGFEHAGHKLPVSKLEKEHMGGASNKVAQNSTPTEVAVVGTRYLVRN